MESKGRDEREMVDLVNCSFFDVFTFKSFEIFKSFEKEMRMNEISR